MAVFTWSSCDETEPLTHYIKLYFQTATVDKWRAKISLRNYKLSFSTAGEHWKEPGEETTAMEAS